MKKLPWLVALAAVASERPLIQRKTRPAGAET
jgi:hypothetical protein